MMNVSNAIESVPNITVIPAIENIAQSRDIPTTLAITTPTPTLTPFEEHAFTTILWTVHHVLDPIVLALGLIGNILAFLVLLRPQYRNQTTCLYMRILAVFDTLIILLKNVQRTVIMWNPHLLENYELGKWFCPQYWFFSYHIYGLSNWTVVCMTFDRFIAVCYPFKASTWCTKKRAKISAAVIVLSMSALQAPSLLTEPDRDNINLGKNTCAYKKEFIAPWYPHVRNILFCLLSLGAPLVIVVGFNIGIVTKVVGRKQEQEKMGVAKGCSKAEQKSAQALILLFIVTGVFVFTNLPWVLDQLVWEYLLEWATGENYRDNYRLTRLRPVVYEVLMFFLFTNSSVNFYIYCMGCRKFRKDLIKMFKGSYGKSEQFTSNGSNGSETKVHADTKL